MIIVVLGVVVFGELGEVVMLVFLFLISEGLEEYVMVCICCGLCVLLLLVLDQVIVLWEGIEIIVVLIELYVGDQMIVKLGECLVIDGIICVGCIVLDVFVIIGELVLVEVGFGDEVFVGLINGLGVLQVGVIVIVVNNLLVCIVYIVEVEQV